MSSKTLVRMAHLRSCRALALAAATCLLAFSLTRCGGPPSDRVAILTTLRTAAHGILTGDGSAVCATFTQSEIDTVAEAGVLLGVGATCVRAIDVYAQDLSVTVRAQLAHIALHHLVIQGKHASGIDSTGGSPDRFTKVGGHWYISGGFS